MNAENKKTLIFAAAAVGCLLMGWAAHSASLPKPNRGDDELGEALFAEFTDPTEATRLRIVSLNEASGKLDRFEVAKEKGEWVIPSHENYPADAQRQLEEAAGSVVDLKKLSIVTDQKVDHEIYGVVEPDDSVEPGAKGVGKLVEMEDETGKKLCQLIIGVADRDNPKLRFVRLPSQDRVYRVEVDPSRLSTKFEDWIEKDLLKLNTWDLKEITVSHDTVDETEGRIIYGERFALSFDVKEGKWSMPNLSAGEEIDKDKVEGLKNALDGLKIVDVHVTPRKLQQLVSGESLQQDVELIAMHQSMLKRGFYLGTNSIVPVHGSMRLDNADGVLYTLNFGAVASALQGAKEDEKDGEAKSEEGLNRYLFVMAHFDQSLLPLPELKVKTLPEDLLPAAPEAAPAEGEAPAEAPPADEKAPAGEAPAEKPAEPAAGNPGPRGAVGQSAVDQLAQAEDAQPAEKTPENKPAAEAPAAQKPAEEQPAEKTDPPAEAPAGEESKPAAEGEDADAQAAEEKRKAEEDRAKAEKDDDRKINEFRDKIKKGQERAKELNARFSAWYYVISNAEYKKIHLTRDQVIKAKAEEKKPEGAAESPAGEGDAAPEAPQSPAGDAPAAPADAPAQP